MEIALMALVVFSAILYLAEPLLDTRNVSADRDALIGMRESDDRGGFDPATAILDEIADLDLERAAGKIADANYDTVRSRLVAEAASALKAREDNLSRRVEEQSRRNENQLTRDVSNIQESERSACPACGTSSEPGDRFCAACGAKIGIATDAAAYNAGKKETI